MNAGKLRHRIRILQPVDSITDKGDDDITYDETIEKWVQGAIEPLQGRELLVAQQMRADLSHKITIRFTKGINHRTMFRWIDKENITRNFHAGPTVDAGFQGISLSIYCYEIR